MRRKTQWAILRTEDSYTICKVSHGHVERFEVESNGEEDICGSIASKLDEIGYRGDPVLIGLDSFDCLAASFPHEGRAMLRDRMALKYALEDQLPLSADDIVADFVTFKESALGIVTERSPIESLVEGLGEHGIDVSAVVPTTMLLFAEVCHSDQLKTGSIIGQFSGHWEMVSMIDGKVATWRVLGSNLDRLEQELPASNEEEKPIRLVFLSDSPTSVPPIDGFEVDSIELEADKLLANAVRRYSKDQLSCVDFCNDGEWRAGTKNSAWRNPLVAATLLLGIGMAVGLQVLGHRYEKIADAHEIEQRQFFTEAMPGDRVPVGIRSRLESECAKLAGATGAVTELPQTFSALETLQRTLSQLPEEKRIRVNDLRV
ncbi:hypothetical protein ACFL2H_14125, partial [Planctomycetota bacterium]